MDLYCISTRTDLREMLRALPCCDVHYGGSRHPAAWAHRRVDCHLQHRTHCCIYLVVSAKRKQTLQQWIYTSSVCVRLSSAKQIETGGGSWYYLW
jgi:hypothetical protein